MSKDLDNLSQPPNIKNGAVTIAAGFTVGSDSTAIAGNNLNFVAYFKISCFGNAFVGHLT